MSKLIINNRSDLPMGDALRLCGRVVKGGKVSDNGTSYCAATIFRIGDSGRRYAVHGMPNKSSDTLTVVNYGKQE